MARRFTTAVCTFAIGAVALWAAMSPNATANPNADAGAADATPPFLQDTVANGTHWRFDTTNGPVHVWIPDDYRAESAGTVLYLHGYWTHIDQAWVNHSLPEQFAASGRNAIFIAPEAPANGRESVAWRSLGALLREVKTQTNLHRAWGNVVVMGHSGAYRSILPWLKYRHVSSVILLDAMYGQEDDFAYWLERHKGHDENQLISIASDTLRWGEPFLNRFDDAEELDRIPDDLEELNEEQTGTRFLYMRSQITHMGLVTDGHVIPMMLKLTRLEEL
jgi:hypothetical protein